jgi:putative nucleotidyltransferase with HDIG domain
MSYLVIKINNKIVEDIISIYNENGDRDYIGEKITQMQHALQSAYLASQENSLDNEFIIAALFHDIGHIIPVSEIKQMGNFGIATHERLGAEYLSNLGFPIRVCELIRLHVSAKRYLITTKPEYLSNISGASLETLKYQGGKMTPDEIEKFENNKYYKDAVRLRYIDDYAKKQVSELGIDIPNIESYKSIICSLLETQ